LKLDSDDRLWLLDLVEDAVEAVVTAIANQAGASAKEATTCADFGGHLFRELQERRANELKRLADFSPSNTQ
jgi:hypothetical protein